MKKRRSRRLIWQGVSLVLVFCMLAAFLCPGAFASANTAVNDVAKGVLQINADYLDENDVLNKIAVGSCFLINDKTIVTTNHTLDVSNIVNLIVASTGNSVEWVRSRLSYSVTLSRDVTIKATLKHNSREMDFAIMELTQSLQTTLPLSIRHSSEVMATEQVYAIGFPEQSSDIQDINTYQSYDVTIEGGRVNKVNSGLNTWASENSSGNPNYIDHIQTSCNLPFGISGGPMVDSNGCVIGICQSQNPNSPNGTDSHYFYAICIDQLLVVCDSLGIPYHLFNNSTPSPSPVPTPTPGPIVDVTELHELIQEANEIVKSDYTSYSYSALEDAVKNGNSALTSDEQSTVDNASKLLKAALNSLEKKESFPIAYVMTGVAVVAIFVVVFVLLRRRATRATPPVETVSPPAPAPTPENYIPPTPTPGPGPATPKVRSTPPTLDIQSLDIDDRSNVLTDFIDQVEYTTLLVYGGFLTRIKDNSKIEIKQEKFRIGRSRDSNLMIHGNTHVGRDHCDLIVRDNKTYICDLDSKNGTFVNGTRCDAYSEYELHDNDKIRLGDEEFVYHK